MLEGDLPNRARNLTVEWAKQYQSELIENWINGK
jgi:hypothetical protein